MSAQGVVALLLWLSCCVSALWRYSCNNPNFLISSKRTTIKLEYEGTSFSEWSVPTTCSVEDKRLPKTDMRCSPGFQVIKPIVSAPDLEKERYLFVANSHQCFSWNYKVINDFTKSTQVVFIWIYDPENADPDEVQRNASEPSLYSKALVKQFVSFGQMPTIQTIKKRKTYFPDEGIKNGMWSITIPKSFGDGLKEIKGRPVAFLNCLVANSISFLTFPFSTIPEMIDFLPISSPRGSQLMADWEACATSNIVVVADMETFQSNDSFQTWTRIRVPPNVLTDEERSSVSDVSFSLEGVFFLIKGILYIKSLHEFTRLETTFNLPDEIIGITTRKWCWDKYLLKVKDKISYIAVWTRDALYLGYEHLKFIKVIDTNKLKQLLYVSPASSLSIHNVEYTEHPLELALLLETCVSCNISKALYLIIYNEDTEKLLFKDLKMLIHSGSHLSMHFVFSATPEFILTDKHRVYYYYQNFADTGILQTPTEAGNLSKLSQDSTIHQVFMDYFGNIIVKMENNDMFFFKNHIKEAVKLHSWTTNTQKSLISMLPFSQVYFIYVSENGDISTQAYPLQLEVQNVAFRKREVCPYIAFHSNILNDIYFLDKGQNLSFWVQVVYPEIRSMYILMESNGPNILGKKGKDSYEAAKGQSTKTKAIDFFQSGNFEGVEDYFRLQNLKTGIVLFSFKPSDSGNTCLNPQKVFQVAVGCDSTKYIIVKGSYLRHQPSTNLKVKYDRKINGCPLKVNIREKFQPLIQLYNEDGYVEDIYVNFIVWEINGRNDYTFSNTMAQSGCLTEAQTWKSMTELNKGIPLEDVWGPENYIHCFSYSGKQADLNQPYEIINKTNKNHLVWPMDHTGMYVFRVKILDPNYSFCSLTAHFAIETYGLISRPIGSHIAAAILILTLLFFAALFFSYNYFMDYVHQPDITYLVHNHSHKRTKKL